jgi:gluconokinase
VSAPQVPTTTVVIMGVSGSGKTTVAMALAHQLGWDFAEGDAFHPDENVRRMRSGHALDDEDRWPWLRRLAEWIGARERQGVSAVLTCSALKRSYRDLLRDGHPSVWFAFLAVDREVLLDRVVRRSGHYMPPSLLDSQLETLEPLQPDEPGVTLDADRPGEEVVAALIAALRAQHRLPVPAPPTS